MLNGPVVLVADAGKTAGLGHISRCSAVAVALRCRGVQVRCFANGVTDPFERDGVDWTPINGEQLPPAPGGILVVDSYRFSPSALAAASGLARLVVLHDFGEPPPTAALVVAVAVPSSDGGSGRLGGLAHAALRPAFWGLPERDITDPVRRVLVTTGSGMFGEFGCAVAQAVRDALPEVNVAIVRGPDAAFLVPAGIELIDAPDSLVAPLLEADLVITAAGQTMLEAAACGTPSVAMALVENQRRQALLLTELGAVLLVDPPEPAAAAIAVSELCKDIGRRRQLGHKGQQAVDGYGALRIAFRIAQLAGRSS
jgi:UDP-2,4-diacetamido-2,4,6-trideoxy-beta-L-altropyranose hydrolase